MCNIAWKIQRTKIVQNIILHLYRKKEGKPTMLKMYKIVFRTLFGKVYTFPKMCLSYKSEKCIVTFL